METKAAVVYERSGKFNMEKLEISDPRDDEVLVRIAAVGLCHTDLAGREQYLPIPPDRAFPAVFGHEGAGVVETVGARVTKVKPGDHVALSWDFCGACPSCKSGNEPYCDNLFLHNFNGARPDGSTSLRKGDQVIYGSFFCQSSFSELSLANERNVVKVREDIPLEILGPLGCGIRTGAGAVMNTLHPRPGASIAIFGVGPRSGCLRLYYYCRCGYHWRPPRKGQGVRRHPYRQCKRDGSGRGSSGHYGRRSAVYARVRRQSSCTPPGGGRPAAVRCLRAFRGCAAGHGSWPGYGPDYERPDSPRHSRRRFRFRSLHPQTARSLQPGTISV